MPESWTVTTIGEACDVGTGDVQTGPFGSQLHAADYVPSGVPSIMPQDLKDDRVSIDGIARIRESDAVRLSRYRVAPGDIVYSRRGDVERRALVTNRESGWLCGTGCLRVRLGNPRIDSKFFYYYLGHPAVRGWIVRHAHGATMPNLNTSILRAVPLSYPPIEEQRRIAAVLGALDDKIALNRKMNRTLEEMAQALFKSWFIDFDGHDPADLVDSPLGPIPRGWEVRAIGDVVRVLGGSTPSTKEASYWDGGRHAWATPKDLSGLNVPVLLDTERHITDDGLRTISSGLMPAGTFLLSSRAPIGYVAITQVPIAVNQGFIAIPPSGDLPSSYLLFWTRFNLEAIKGRAGGTTFPEISKAAFRPILAVVPPSDHLGRYEAIVGTILARVVASVRQSKTLAELRDTLLPKLISGELRVPDAEAAAMEAL